MNDERENFDALQRLLKVKRYEQPPPRYFNEFSGQVLARISAGEQGGEVSGWEVGTWIERLLSGLGSRPVVPATLGGAVCAVFMAGLVFMDTSADQNMDALWSLGAAEANPASPVRPMSNLVAVQEQHGAELGSLESTILAGQGTNAVGIAFEHSLFGRIQPLPPKLASDPVGSK
ncbi:MAG: hypothetical protein KIS67_10155 [Verrucomicrobiae bacterium]|nr:hypothetical protein [Verrucomicrobiae bacterium]